MHHHFTVDVEEYFQVSALEDHVRREDWPRLESRVRVQMDALLEEMSLSGARGTFFVLGWLAERHPDLVSELARAGHEVASHGWGHRRVNQLSAADFRTSVRRSRALLEHIIGGAVVGYRAPSFSIVRGCEWALDVLIEEGYTYDSSLFPIRRPGYGYAGGQRDPHWLERAAGRLAELPPATLRLPGMNLPAGGGAYLRLLPFGLVRGSLRQAARRGVPGTFYMHPWELDPEQPRLPVGALTRVRHYGGLSRTRERVRRLLREFRFEPMRDTVARMAGEEMGAAGACASQGHSPVAAAGVVASSAEARV